MKKEDARLLVKDTIKQILDDTLESPECKDSRRSSYYFFLRKRNTISNIFPIYLSHSRKLL